MFKIKWLEIFPTKLSVCIFISYVLLFVSYSVFIKASQNHASGYNYNVALVVLLTEIVKLSASVVFFCKRNSEKSLIIEIRDQKTLLVLYFIPSLLYCAYNNLAFKNLTVFDPTTYQLLLQFRVVMTAILFQIIFKKRLTLKQWFSLVLLTFGCILKEVDFSSAKTGFTPHLNFAVVLILLQSFLSCLAGVYNEYLIKTKGLNTDIFLQNIFMYLDSIICNVGVLVFQTGSDVVSVENFKSLLNLNVLLIVANSAAVGIVTSFFLKTMNSILKTFASAIELIFTALLCFIIFGIQISNATVLAIIIVIFSVVLYSQNPVKNQPLQNEGNEPLLQGNKEDV